MLSTDCAYCGASNQATAQVCVACGDDLTLQPAFIGHDQDSEWEPQIDPNQPLSGNTYFGVDTAIAETLSFFGSNLWLITKIVVVTVAPFELFRQLNLAEIRDQYELMAWSFFLKGVCNVLVVPAVIYALTKVILTGKEPGVHQSYRWGLTKLGKVTCCAVIITALQALGYALLIIPGIIVSLVYILVYPIAVLEKGSVAEVFARSIELTRGHRLQIFAVWAITSVLLLVLSTVGSFIIEVSPFWLVKATVATVGDILDQAAIVLSLVLYLSLPRTSASGGPTVLSLSK